MLRAGLGHHWTVPRLLIAAIGVLCCLATPARGDEPMDTAPSSEKRKAEAAVLPSIAFNADDGVGLGAFGDVEMPALPSEERFHLWRLSLIARVWLKPPQVGWELRLGWSWFPTPDGATEIAANIISLGRPWDWWFGVGQSTVRDTRFVAEDDPVPLYWHRFTAYDVRGDVHVFRRIVGPLDGFVGGGLKATWLTVQPDTLLAKEVEDGLHDPTDGLIGFVDGGLRLDARDSRTDPTNGVYALGFAQLNVGPRPVPWGRFVLDVRGYLGVPSGVVVFAGEILGQMVAGDAPFYELGIIGGFDSNQRTLAGVNGLRALDRGRLRGPLGLLLHGEMRLRPPGFLVLPVLRLRLAPVLWVDALRVDTLTAPLVGGPILQPSFGWGLRLVFNEVTVARFDMGTGPERALTPDGATTRWPLGFYGTVGHSF